MVGINNDSYQQRTHWCSGLEQLLPQVRSVVQKHSKTLSLMDYAMTYTQTSLRIQHTHTEERKQTHKNIKIYKDSASCLCPLGGPLEKFTNM